MRGDRAVNRTCKRSNCVLFYGNRKKFPMSPIKKSSALNETQNTMYVKRRIGIQKGQCATDALARKLDVDCRQAADETRKILAREGIEVEFKKKLTKEQIPGNKGACQPDGGLWFIGGKLVCAFEGKKQGNGGNAIERWFKNNFICRMIAPDISYVTFATGPGAVENGVIHNCLNVAHLQGVNQVNHSSNSLFLSEQGFTCDELVTIMVEVLREAAKC